MIIHDNSSVFDGQTLGTGGTAFAPTGTPSLSLMSRLLGDDEEGGIVDSYAVYERDGFACGVNYIVIQGHQGLRFSPNYQIPRGARSMLAWQKFMFEEVEDPRALNLKLDTTDGEIQYLSEDFEVDDRESVTAAIERSLDFLQDMYPYVVRFVREQIVPGK